jgi:hypothetical protein
MAKVAKKVKSAVGVSFMFEDAKKTTLALALSELSQEMIVELAIHGLSQKVGDSYASSETVAEAIESAKDVWANLKAGRFNSAGGGLGGLLVEAIARLKKITIAEAAERLGGATEEQVEVIKKNSAVKNMMTVIRGERAVAKASDVDDDLEL